MKKYSIHFAAIQRFVRFVAQRSGEDRIAQVADSLTFTTVLSLVPLLTVMFALFTAFPVFASFERALQGFLADQLMPEQINSQIFNTLNEFATQAKRLTAAGLVSLGLTSIVTMMTIESAFNVIWRVHRPRPLAQRVLVYWAILTLGPILLGASVSISSWLLSQSLNARTVSPFVGWLLTGATLPLSALAFTMLYVYLPNHRVKWRDAWMGGVLAALAFELSKRGFGLYIRKFPTYTAVYGAFAAVPIFLLWMYLSWLITLCGAMFASALEAFRVVQQQSQRQRSRFAGSDLFDALGLLARLGTAREMGQAGGSTQALTHALHSNIETIAALLARLEAHGWVAQLSADDGARSWVLIANLHTLTVSTLFDLWVIDREKWLGQLERDAEYIDENMLRTALKSNALNMPLAQLFLCCRAHSTALT